MAARTATSSSGNERSAEPETIGADHFNVHLASPLFLEAASDRVTCVMIIFHPG